MIVVVDTNVVISALLSPRGSPAEVFTRWLNGEFDVATSQQLLIELARALTYPQVRKYTGYSDEDIASFIDKARFLGA